MLKTMQSAERDAIFAVADLMAAAAKTAPKGSGRDTIVTAIVSGETKDQAIRAQNRFSCFKDIRISIRTEFFRKEGITVQHKCLFIREGCHQQEQERKQAHQR